ncbi:glycerophosphodiester phosphodiesterase family protein [Bdellovibrio sp. 22V]|uniref:glycerophosphodiester phosphodiesterase family protein n=1 Tax=Bdellovibrio sp. 22V TaxID=3044166 RepID=UPI002543F677|nr:glycerophosphodiester phosphodiesterase family protein [Bdellovibrio sp. 22V]WII73065.1 glycerophosphodiester phosphodiesterase family protein [Bdellovibrio sp. 22V]
MSAQILGSFFILIFSIGCASTSPTPQRQPSSAPLLCQNISRMEIHSHRGAWDRPENMLSAFHRGVEQGADFIEMDLQVSKDNQLVVAHDVFMKDECLDAHGKSLPQRVYYRNMTVQEIKSYDCGSKVKTGTPVPGEKISTLTEVIKSLKNRKTSRGLPLGLNIEIKYNPTQPQYYPSRDFYVDRLLEVLDQTQVNPGQVMVQSFDVEILKVVRKKRPSIRLSPLFGDAKNALQIAKDLNVELITPHYGQVSPAMLASFHSNGIRVIPWTVNYPEEALKLVEWGVDGLITDHPEWIDFTKKFCQ